MLANTVHNLIKMNALTLCLCAGRAMLSVLLGVFASLWVITYL